MADYLSLTAQPVKVSTIGFQPIFLAPDISAYDMVVFISGLVATEGTVGSFTLSLYTSMQNQSDDGWLQVGTLLNTATIDTYSKQTFSSGLLRYLRWNVTVLSGSSPVATFFVRGLCRRLS